jgi:phosphate transport system substrate-binding protein
VFGGGGFTGTMSVHDVAFSHGVERFVAENQNAIGFAQHTRRNHPVKSLAIGPDHSSATVANADTEAAGSYPLTRHLYLLLGYQSPRDIPEAELKFVDRLLSREGQRTVAEAGSFALSTAEVLASRRLLGL